MVSARQGHETNTNRITMIRDYKGEKRCEHLKSTKGPTFPLLKCYLKHCISYLWPCTLEKSKKRIQAAAGEKKVCLRASQPFLILFSQVAKYSRFFSFCPFSGVHVLSPESLNHLRDSYTYRNNQVWDRLQEFYVKWTKQNWKNKLLHCFNNSESFFHTVTY